MLKAFLSGELADLIGGECDEKSILVKNFSHLVNADKNSISFFYDNKYKKELLETKAAVVILKKKRLSKKRYLYYYQQKKDQINLKE